MTTKLEGSLRREVEVDGALYTLTITPEGLALVPKGRRKGYELRLGELNRPEQQAERPEPRLRQCQLQALGGELGRRNLRLRVAVHGGSLPT